MPSTTSTTPLNTVSDNGRNIRADLKSESFFFLESGKNFTQANNQKFGIVSSGNTSVFRSTSQITGYSGKIFTICKGQIFVQPNSADPDKVNIILKPFLQPINGIAIKYIIYRGLNKQDFFENGKVKPSDGGNATEFVKHIRAEFKAFYQMLKKEEPEFLADYIGYQADNGSIPVDQQQKNEDLIDAYFFKSSDFDGEAESAKVAFELPIIPEGICLGEITDDTLGIDIILNEGDYTIANDPNPFQLNLSYARASDFILNTGGYSGLQEKLIKESATWFIDIAAFYGLHTQGNGKVHLKPANETLQSTDDIYNLIKNFKTKNTTYLYIQSNRQRSYNFYGNYNLNGKNIKIGTDSENLQEKLFGNNGWSVEVFENTSNSETLLLALANNKNYFDKIFYIDVGNPQEKNKDALFVRELKNVSENNDKDYIETVSFGINKSAGLIKLLYVGDNIAEPYLTKDPYFLSKHHNVIRELYSAVNIRKSFNLEDNFISIACNKKSFVSLDSFSNLQYSSIINNSLIFYEGKKQEGEDFSYKLKVLFLAKKEDTIDSNQTNNRDLIFGTRSSMITNIPKNNEANFQMLKLYGDTRYRYYYNEIKDNTDTIKLLKLKLEDEIDTTYFSIGILKEEYETLMATIPAGASNVKLYIDEEEQNPLLGTDAKKSYFKYSLGINYEDGNGDLKILFPNEKIYVYGDNIYFFSSKEFAEYEYSITPEPLTEY